MSFRCFCCRIFQELGRIVVMGGRVLLIIVIKGIWLVLFFCARFRVFSLSLVMALPVCSSTRESL